MRYDVTKLDQELRAAGIPIDGVSGSTVGRIDFAPEATAEQRAEAAAIKAAHDSTPTPLDQLRKAGINEREAALALVLAELLTGAPAPAWASEVLEEFHGRITSAIK